MVVGVEMKGAKVDVLQVENGGEVFARGAIVVEIPIVGAGAVVEVAVSAKGDEVVGVERFDVLAYIVSPIGQDLAAVAFGVLASGLRIGQAVVGIQGWVLYFVGELPCEDCGGVFVSGDDFAHIVLEGVDDGWVGIEFCLRVSVT